MITSIDLNRAISKMRKAKRDTAGREAYEAAQQLLPFAAEYRTPADLAALWIMSLALYYAAVNRNSDERAYGTLISAVEKRYAMLMDGVPSDKVFAPRADYPEELYGYLRALTQLPLPIVLSAMEMVRDQLAALRTSEN